MVALFTVIVGEARITTVDVAVTVNIPDTLVTV
jgi:hypothetical protein